eukprot:5136242-Amphidinium_carterae.1
MRYTIEQAESLVFQADHDSIVFPVARRLAAVARHALLRCVWVRHGRIRAGSFNQPNADAAAASVVQGTRRVLVLMDSLYSNPL